MAALPPTRPACLPRPLVCTRRLQVVCAALLALLFRVIARAADDFFSCILSQISQDLGLPPRLGGVTLLALGTGAPDLSACIAAVKTGTAPPPAAMGLISCGFIRGQRWGSRRR